MNPENKRVVKNILSDQICSDCIAALPSDQKMSFLVQRIIEEINSVLRKNGCGNIWFRTNGEPNSVFKIEMFAHGWGRDDGYFELMQSFVYGTNQKQE